MGATTGAAAHSHRPSRWRASPKTSDWESGEQTERQKGCEDVERTRGALLESRPPQSSSRPSARAAAAAYMRAQGPSPVAWTLCHLYGFTAVSSAQASARGCGRRGELAQLWWRSSGAHLVAVVAAEDEQETLADVGEDVRIASPGPLSLHHLFAGRMVVSISALLTHPQRHTRGARRAETHHPVPARRSRQVEDIQIICRQPSWPDAALRPRQRVAWTCDPSVAVCAPA